MLGYPMKFWVWSHEKLTVQEARKNSEGGLLAAGDDLAGLVIDDTGIAALGSSAPAGSGDETGRSSGRGDDEDGSDEDLGELHVDFGAKDWWK